MNECFTNNMCIACKSASTRAVAPDSFSRKDGDCDRQKEDIENVDVVVFSFRPHVRRSTNRRVKNANRSSNGQPRQLVIFEDCVKVKVTRKHRESGSKLPCGSRGGQLEDSWLKDADGLLARGLVWLCQSRSPRGRGRHGGAI